MTANNICYMSEDDLLDMDYFLNEYDEFDEEFPGAERTPISSGTYRLLVVSQLRVALFISRFLQRRTFL